MTCLQYTRLPFCACIDWMFCAQLCKRTLKWFRHRTFLKWNSKKTQKKRNKTKHYALNTITLNVGLPLKELRHRDERAERRVWRSSAPTVGRVIGKICHRHVANVLKSVGNVVQSHSNGTLVISGFKECDITLRMSQIQWGEPTTLQLVVEILGSAMV